MPRALFRSLSRTLTAAENLMLGGLMLYAAGMLCVQVFCRYLLDISFFWAEESVRYAIIWMVFIGASAAFRLDAHIRIDVVARGLPAGARKGLSLIIILICMVFAVVLLIEGLALVNMMRRFGQTSPALEVPMYQVYAVIPVASAMMLFRLLESAARVLYRRADQPAPVAVELAG